MKQTLTTRKIQVSPLPRIRIWFLGSNRKSETQMHTAYSQGRGALSYNGQVLKAHF